MTLFAFPIGGITIGDVRLSTDPETYEPFNWTKRYSVHKHIGGGQTIQDFGVFQRDNTLKLASGERQILDTATVIALHVQYRTRGVSFSFTDWLGNTFTVFYTTFVPIPFRPNLWRYTMDLQVTTIAQLFGSPYSGG